MRVVIVIDGKNFHWGLKRAAGEIVRLDFPRLADWLVERVGGDSMWGAHYYTGEERGEGASAEGQVALRKFLTTLEYEPGYFVRRFARKSTRQTCDHCGSITTYSQEKEVDTSMVADVLRLAAVDGFDALVLVSGDADLAPAVENVRALGKKVYVATWGTMTLAARMRQAAFDHIDLRDGLAEFRYAGRQPDAIGAAASGPRPDTLTQDVVTSDSAQASAEAAVEQATPRPVEGNVDRVFLLELERAERNFAPDGYVGLSYFLSHWRSNLLDEDYFARKRTLDRLAIQGHVEVYEADDGSAAIRRAATTSQGAGGSPDPQQLPAQDETQSYAGGSNDGR